MPKFLISTYATIILTILFFSVLLGVALREMQSTNKKDNEAFAYTYPYDFIECARRKCKSRNHRLHEYLTDEEAFHRVYSNF